MKIYTPFLRINPASHSVDTVGSSLGRNGRGVKLIYIKYTIMCQSNTTNLYYVFYLY